jgi:hypothetical protein
MGGGWVVVDGGALADAGGGVAGGSRSPRLSIVVVEANNMMSF